MGDRKVMALQGSYRVTTRQLRHLGESKPSKIEGIVHIEVASVVDILKGH